MVTLRRILVGVELYPKRPEVTPGARNALTQATWLARETGAELLLVHSTWRDGDVDDAGGEAIDPLSRLSAEALAALEAARVAAAGEGGEERRVELTLTPNRAWLAITRAVLAGGIDMVLVGKRDEAASEGRRLGTVASKLLRKCPGPVWVVKPEHDLVHRLVLAASDLTPVGDLAVVYAAFVAERHRCPLHVVHAYQVPMALQLEAARLSEERYQAELEALKARAQSLVDAVISATSFDGESVVHVGRNAPSAAIREAVEHLHPDLLVMGTVSRGGIAGLLVGNTAERLLDRVDCSLLTVKPEGFVSPIRGEQ